MNLHKKNKPHTLLKVKYYSGDILHIYILLERLLLYPNKFSVAQRFFLCWKKHV